MKIPAAGLALATAAASAAFAADDAAIARCRGIADNAARLACYDALPVGSAFRAPAPSAAPATPGASPMPPAARVAPSAPAAPPPAARAPAAPAAEAFGMEERIAQQEQPKTMESTIPGHFGGWGPRERIKLANGQVWQVVDDSSAYLNLDNPKVVIRRGMMGGFFLEVEKTTRTARVRRIQ